MLRHCSLESLLSCVVAIEFGLVLAAGLFLKRMAEVSEIRGWKYVEKEEEGLRVVPEGTLVYEVEGPMFFAVADQFLQVSLDRNTKVVIMRMRTVPAMDVSALRKLQEVYKACQKHHVTLIFSHVTEQPMKMMEKAGFVEEVGRKNFVSHTEEALRRAEKLCGRKIEK